jgi:PAS domain S-box-containing protein
MDKNERILIVDDDEGTRAILKLIFAREGYQIEVAGTGREAINKARAQTFNLALLDIRLPDMQGVELLNPLKEIHPDIELLIVTGYASIETAVQALNSGASGYITKPVNVDEVLTKIKDLLGKQRLVAEKRQAEKAREASENRYRNLFENVPISLWEEDFSAAKAYVDRLRDQGIEDLREHFERNPEEVMHCATLARVLDVNRATLELFDAESKEELFGALSHVFRQDSYPIFREELLALAEGRPEFSAEIINRTLSGQDIHVSLNLSLAPGAERTWSRVLVSLTDITKRVEAEAALRAERDRAQRYLDIAGVVMLALNRRGEITLINRKGQTILGYSEQELAGENWFDICLPARIREDVRSVFNRLMKGDSPYPDYYENPVLTKSGEERIFAWHNIVLKDKAGAIIGTLSSGEDITEKLRAVQEVEERRRYLERILAAAPDAIVTLDAENRIAEWNLGAERLFGYSRQEAIGDDLNALVTNPETFDEAERFSQAVFDGEEVGPVETIRCRKDGSPIQVIVAGSPILVGDELIGRVIVYTDITQLVQAKEALRRRNRELTTLYEAATAVSSNLSLSVVLETVAEQMTRALDSSGCALSLWNRERNLVETLVDYHMASTGQTVPPGTLYNLNDYPATRHVLETRQPMIIQHDDPSADQAELSTMAEQEISILLMLPLIVRDRVLGLAELVDSDGRLNYTPEEVRLAESMAAQAAVAIENARLYEQAQREIAERARAENETRRRNREMVLLNRVIMAVTSTLDADYALNVTCKELAQAFDLPYATALLLDAEGTEATVVAEHRALGRPSRLGESMPVAGNPAVKHVLQHRAPLTVSGAQTDEWQAAASSLMRRFDTRSLLLVPITLARGRAAGVIGLHAAEHRDFTDDEIAVAQNVAAATGQALETARLYQALRRNVENLEETIAQRTAELEVALERARDADRVKSEFVSNVSHELRTPLTSLKLYLGLLARGQPGKCGTYLDILRRETDRLQNLIEALLDVSRLDLGKTRANLQPTDLNLLVGTLATDRRALAVDRGLSLDVKLAEGLPLAQADPKLIEQVLTNLLTNAFNYTPAGGKIALSTAVAKAEDRQWITASVSDTGPGIPDEEQPHLFERFYRGAAGRASDAPGTGLGLAICKQIMDLHDGQITLASEPGRGSTFTAWLPLPF